MPRCLRARCSILLPYALAVAACLRPPSDLEGPERPRAAPTSATEVLSRHLQAIGGEKAARAVAFRTVEARMRFFPDEGCAAGDESCSAEERHGSFLLQNTADGALYRRTVLEDAVDERGFDGKQAWHLLPDGSVRLAADEEIPAFREDARLHWYLDMESSGVRLEQLAPRDRDSEGAPRVLDGLRWSVDGSAGAGGGGPPKEMWFERATGLLREEIVERGEGSQRIRQITIYEAYRGVDGVLVPDRITVRAEGDAGQRTVQFVTQRVHHSRVAPEIFAVPTPLAPPAKPDALLAALATAQAARSSDPSAQAATRLALAAWDAARFDEAMEAARAALAKAPDEPEALWVSAAGAVMAGRLDEAQRTIARARKAGVRPSELGRQEAWIASHRRDYRAMARALDEAEQPELAGRYRSFAGRPLELVRKGSCTSDVPYEPTGSAFTVPLKVGGREVRAVVDTGASDLLLDAALGAELGIAEQGRLSLGEGAEAAYGQVPEVSLGSFVLRNVPVDLVPSQMVAGMAGLGEGSDVRAVIGMRMLEGFQVSFDPSGRQLGLVSREKPCKKDLVARRTGVGVPIWIHETHFVYLLATMNGAEGLYLLNSGMRGVAVTANPRAYDHAGIAPPVLRPGSVAAVAVRELAVPGGPTLRDARGAWGYLEHTATADRFRFDGMVGLDLLAQGRLTVDLDERRAYFGPSSKPPG